MQAETRFTERVAPNVDVGPQALRREIGRPASDLHEHGPLARAILDDGVLGLGAAVTIVSAAEPRKRRGRWMPDWGFTSG